MIKRFLVSTLLLSIGTIAHAADLMEIYHHALRNDPQFKAAYSTFLAQAEAIPQAQSILLPQLGMTGQLTRNNLNVTSNRIKTGQYYNGQQLVLSASQAIFNLQAWDNVNLAKASVKSSYATYNDAAQNLILRTAQAYFNVLFAKDTLTYSTAKKMANKRQLEQAQDRFNVGVDTMTSIYEAQAAYDQSVAQVIAAENTLINENENLRKITNAVYNNLSPLRDNNVPLIIPEPKIVDDWIATGLKQNYLLLAAKFSLQAARENIKAQSTGAWPTFAIQGTSTQERDSIQNSFLTPSQQGLSTVALTMNFPGIQGGLVESLTRQAKYEFQTSSEQLEQNYRSVLVNSRISFNNIVTGISQVKADRQTVFSQNKSLESTTAQYLVGTRTMLDVTNVQTYLYQAQERLASDQYQYIMSILTLKYYAGSLSVTDLEEINSWLQTTRFDGLPKKYLSNNLKKH